MSEPVYTYETEKAVVRIYTGKRTAEERRAALEESAKRFFKEIQKKEGAASVQNRQSAS